MTGEENISLSILRGLLLTCFEALWQYHLHVNSVKGYTKMTGRPPVLAIYAREADKKLYKKGTTFNSMEDIRKGYLLLKIVYIRDRTSR